MNEYSMPRYFQNMKRVGEALYAPDEKHSQKLREKEAAFDTMRPENPRRS